MKSHPKVTERRPPVNHEDALMLFAVKVPRLRRMFFVAWLGWKIVRITRPDVAWAL